MRNSSVDRKWTVIDCKWMCVEGGLCVILSFERFKKCPTHCSASVCAIHESASVVYASSMRDYARNTRRSSVLMRQNWFKTAHVHAYHTSYDARTAHVSRSSRNDACTWNVRVACVF